MNAPSTMPHTLEHRGEMSQPIPTTPEEAAHISAQMDQYEAISARVRPETEGMSQQHPHQWAGMNSD